MIGDNGRFGGVDSDAVVVAKGSGGYHHGAVCIYVDHSCCGSSDDAVGCKGGSSRKRNVDGNGGGIEIRSDDSCCNGYYGDHSGNGDG